MIEEPKESTSTEPTEQFLLLSEHRAYPDDGSPLDWVSIVMDFDWEHVTNGQLNPTMTFKKGEKVRFRAVNAGIEPDMTISIEGHTLLPVAMDGYPVPHPEPAESVTMDGGARADFLVQFDTPGTYRFERAAWNAGIEGPVCLALFNLDVDHCVSYDKVTDVGTIVVLDEEVAGGVDELDSVSETNGSNEKEMHPYLESLLALPMAGSRVIEL